MDLIHVHSSKQSNAEHLTLLFYLIPSLIFAFLISLYIFFNTDTSVAQTSVLGEYHQELDKP